MTQMKTRRPVSALAPAFALSALALLGAGCGAPVDLTVTTYTSDATFAVGSYLIAGPREAVLVDGQFTKADAEKVVQLVKGSGKTLKAVFVTHAHPDHYLGLDVIRQAFPTVPMQAIPEVVVDFNAKAPAALAGAQGNFPPGTIADKLVTLTPLADATLSVDGEVLQVVKLPEGEAVASAVLYAPRQQLLFAGDNVYNRAYLWLAECKTDGWTANLDRLRALGGLSQIYPGHGPAPATAAVLDEDAAYLKDAVAIFRAAPNAAEGIKQVRQKYPSYTGGGLLDFSTPGYFMNCKK
jgi:glyoxylase-like metal-dependent hydrolase (beta-lactamase superfamily II)